jgi:hypothetical protein
MRLLRLSITFWAIFFACAIIFINYRLYNTVQIVENEDGKVNVEVVKQLHFLQDELENKGMAERQQEFYPEGLIFAHTNYALAWIEILKTIKPETDLYKNGKAQVLKSLKILNEGTTKNIFSADMNPENGVFYNGWKAYVQGEYLELENRKLEIGNLTVGRNEMEVIDTAVLNDYKRTCAALSAAFQTRLNDSITNNLFLESYSGGVWVADNIIAVAALKRFSSIEKDEKTAKLVEIWTKRLENQYQSTLISHTVDYKTGLETDAARGCSQSLILCFLPELDSTFARKHYDIYIKNYKDSHFGLPFLREYERYDARAENGGDVDSGPVIWNVGPVASLMIQKAAKLNGDFSTANALRNEAECFGFAYTNSTEKYYLGGKIPIADCFLAYLNADNVQYATQLNQTFWWRLPFQILSSLLLFFGFVVWKWSAVLGYIMNFKMFK